VACEVQPVANPGGVGCLIRHVARLRVAVEVLALATQTARLYLPGLPVHGGEPALPRAASQDAAEPFHPSEFDGADLAVR
jgi:hypothetical protein